MYNIETINFLGEKIFKAHFSGQFQCKLFFEFIDCLGDYEKRYPSNKLIVDISKIARGPTSFDELKSVVRYNKANGKRVGKTVFVTGDDLMRSLIVKLIVDLISVFRPNKIAAFKSTEEATSWLCSCDFKSLSVNCT